MGTSIYYPYTISTQLPELVNKSARYVMSISI